MKLHSESFAHGQPIPPAFVIGRRAHEAERKG